jgi:hypothetical protein
MHASSVAVRLTGAPRIGDVTVGPGDMPAGLAYMLWTVFQQKRTAILPGERFRLRLQARHWPLPPVVVQGLPLDLNARFDLSLASLWLVLRLGGLGARTRRCGGTLRALAAPDGWPDALPPLAGAATTPAEWVAEVSAGISRVRAFASWRGPAPADPSSFDLLHPNVCQLFLVDRTFPTWWEAADWMGTLYHAFRVAQRDDASAIAALLTQGRLAARTIVRAVFGLPLQFFFKTIHAALLGQGVEPREARRRASASIIPTRGLARGSPLFFRVVPFAGEPLSYGVLMGLFRSRFLPDHEMTVRPGDYSLKPVRIATPTDFKLITQWFDYVRGQGAPLLPVALG